MKKCISFLLILALMLTMIPVSAFAAEEATEFITIEVSVDTTVREKASQDAKVLSKVKRGGYLISTGSVTNRWGNVWFRVVDPTTGEEGFIYSGKVHEHQCDYQYLYCWRTCDRVGHPEWGNQHWRLCICERQLYQCSDSR